MNLANQLTLLRMGMALAMFAALMQAGAGFHEAAFLLFALAMATDWVDGYVARRFHTVSAFGKVADPVADKILVVGALIGLIRAHIGVPLWGVFLIIARELLMGGLRVLASAHGKVHAAQPWGKWSMGVQSGCVLAMLGLLMIEEHPSALSLPIPPLCYWLTIVCVAAAWSSAYSYYRQSQKMLEKSWE